MTPQLTHCLELVMGDGELDDDDDEDDDGLDEWSDGGDEDPRGYP